MADGKNDDDNPQAASRLSLGLETLFGKLFATDEPKRLTAQKGEGTDPGASAQSGVDSELASDPDAAGERVSTGESVSTGADASGASASGEVTENSARENVRTLGEVGGDAAQATVPARATVPEQAAAPEVGKGSGSGNELESGNGSGRAKAPEPVKGSEPVKESEQAKEPQKKPEPLTAVSLGLIPANFVSAVSTELLFYAPEVAPLPARAGRGDYQDDDEDQSSGNHRRTRRRGDEDASDSSSNSQQGNQKKPGRRQRDGDYVTEPQRIKGSTRLEAKKQRRRDGRDAGRRRMVVTEAEFLARRESVDREMIVRSKNGRVQIAVLEDQVLVEHYVARNQDASLIGNVYLGRVQNVLPSMEAAFVDIGRGRNAVLYSGEVDWDLVETGNQPRRIELALKTGDRVLVQVTKDPVGHKGARLTSQISLPGRYLVYVPGGAMNGISRKLPDTERARLKKILKEVLPESSGVIVRTAAEGATEEQLTRDVQRLTAQWEHVSAHSQGGAVPSLLHSEPDLLVKIVRDVFNEDFTKMLIQGEDAHRTITSYLEGVAPDLLERIAVYESDADPFDEFRVTEQIEKALDRKVWLPSGGSLVIDRTEAMTVIDVNTGKFVGSGGNLEETVTKNNLEAAEEIARQLRLRDIGGIIVVDFIDMVLESNRDLVLRRVIECLSRDRTKHQVAEVTSLGLVQMTRKKLGLGLLETFSEACEVCAGRGVVVHHDPVVKHRSSSQGGSNNSRRPRNTTPNTQTGGTHVITDGVKSALAQIAASTIPTPGGESVDENAVVDAPAAEAGSAAPDRTGSQGQGGSSDQGSAQGQGGASGQAGSSDRPKRRKKRQGSAQSGPKTEKEKLLDSVLEGLPEPKAPGQGRTRRRVSTAALTGTPVAPIKTDN